MAAIGRHLSLQKLPGNALLPAVLYLYVPYYRLCLCILLVRIYIYVIYSEE